ncbi:MAG: TRAP transporter small permease [Alphaproteobacteria bacterium]|nr:TRAP transporter small permease [Alphaproteobacteria bacterium]
MPEKDGREDSAAGVSSEAGDKGGGRGDADTGTAAVTVTAPSEGDDKGNSKGDADTAAVSVPVSIPVAASSDAAIGAAPEENAPKRDTPSDPFAAVILALGKPFSLLFLASMTILIFEIVMRYVFDRPTIWVHETSIFLCGVCFLFGGLHSISRNGHIRIVLLYDHVSPRMRRRLDIFIYTLCCAATAMFSWAIWPTVVDSYFAPTGEFRMITSGSAWNPPYPALLRVFLFITLIAMTVQFAFLAVNKARGK